MVREGSSVYRFIPECDKPTKLKTFVPSFDYKQKDYFTKTHEINIIYIGEGENAWVDWVNVNDNTHKGSIAISNFPDETSIGNIYYLTLNGSYVEKIVRKLDRLANKMKVL